MNMSDDDIRDAIERARRSASSSPPWESVTAQADRGSTAPRGIALVAAAVLIFALGGSLVLLSQRGEAPAPADQDDPTTTAAPVDAIPAVDGIGAAGHSDWLVPTRLPDGFSRMLVTDRTGIKRQTFTTEDRHVSFWITQTSSRFRPFGDEPGETIDIEGHPWELTEYEFGPDQTSVTLLRISNLYSVGLESTSLTVEELSAVAASLAPVHETDITVDFEHGALDWKTVTSQEFNDWELTLKVAGANEFFCLDISTNDVDDETPGQNCQHAVSPSQPFVIAGGQGGPGLGIISGLTSPEIASVTIALPTGETFSIEPQTARAPDGTPLFDTKFWMIIDDGSGLAGGHDDLAGVSIEYDDGRVVDLVNTDSFRWVLPDNSPK